MAGVHSEVGRGAGANRHKTHQIPLAPAAPCSPKGQRPCALPTPPACHSLTVCHEDADPRDAEPLRHVEGHARPAAAARVDGCGDSQLGARGVKGVLNVNPHRQGHRGAHTAGQLLQEVWVRDAAALGVLHKQVHLAQPVVADLDAPVGHPAAGGGRE